MKRVYGLPITKAVLSNVAPIPFFQLPISSPALPCMRCALLRLQCVCVDVQKLSSLVRRLQPHRARRRNISSYLGMLL